MKDTSVDDAVWKFGAEHLSSRVSPDVFREMVVLRRRFHEFPELAHQELQTAALVRKELHAIDGVLVLDMGVGGTGVVGVIRGEAGPGKTIMFRADMDALPIQETPGCNGVEPSAKRRKVAFVRTDGCCGLCGSAPPQLLHTETNGTAKSNERSWKKHTMSTVPGVSHACGHDGHMAMLIGAAKVLSSRRKELKGQIVLLFQPAEERHPINNPKGGAIRMIRDAKAGDELSHVLGAGPSVEQSKNHWTAEELHFTDPDDTSMDGRLLECIDEVYGLHLWNYANAGTIGCAPGSVTANSDTFEVVVSGTGGHGSSPHGTVDPVVVAAQLVQALQGIVSRNTSPTESCVVTIGKIEGGVAPNVIATSVKLLGTVRTYTMPVKRMVQRRLQEIAAGVAISHGPKCAIEVKFADGYPACVNDPTCAGVVLDAARELLGERLVSRPTPNMAGEDFAFFLNRKPGAFFFVGSNPNSKFALDPSVATENEEIEHGTSNVIFHHTPEFDIHEGALWVGAAMIVSLVQKALTRG